MTTIGVGGLMLMVPGRYNPSEPVLPAHSGCPRQGSPKMVVCVCVCVCVWFT